MEQIRACTPWLEAELARIAEMLVLLGATAAQAFLGRAFRVTPTARSSSPARAARHRDGPSVVDLALPDGGGASRGVRRARRGPAGGPARPVGYVGLVGRSPYHRRMQTQPRLDATALIELVERHSPHNYHPLPVVVAEGEGAWVTDVEGTRYLDMLAAYSALNFGHRHPDLIRAAKEQLDRLTLTSRAFHNDLFGPFCEQLADLCGKDMVLAMNSGAEAVESALKTARRWGYDVKGVPADRAKIVVCDGNFHGRTITIVGFSSDPSATGGFGPFTPGFVSIPFGDADALAAALEDPDVVAFLVEPIQGEAGVGSRRGLPDRGPPALHRAERPADRRRDPVGPRARGTTFACDHEDVRPTSTSWARRWAAGSCRSPPSSRTERSSASSVRGAREHVRRQPARVRDRPRGRAAPRTGEYQQRSRDLGAWFLQRLREEAPTSVREVRGRGLWFGIELTEEAAPARAVCERLLELGVLAKDTQETTVRLAPPLWSRAATWSGPSSGS